MTDELESLEDIKNYNKRRRGRDKVHAFIQAVKFVLSDDDNMNAIILTDAELIDFANERLRYMKKTQYQITQRTLSRWKKGEHIDADLYKEFKDVIRKYEARQKQDLFRKLIDSKDWVKYAWILERKFSKWNIRHKYNTDLTSGGKSLTVELSKEIAEKNIATQQGSKELEEKRNKQEAIKEARDILKMNN
jgi:chorismate mutase